MFGVVFSGIGLCLLINQVLYGTFRDGVCPSRCQSAYLKEHLPAPPTSEWGGEDLGLRNRYHE